VTLNVTAIANLALALLSGALNLIATIRGEGGLTDAQILAAASTQTTANQTLIAQYLAALPPAPAATTSGPVAAAKPAK
jgi:hypothetical protein